jgi:beta-glucanase (GH16 family)
MLYRKWLFFVLLLTGICFGRFDADLDGDKYVGFNDLITIAQYWLDHGNPGCNGDTGSDCRVDMADIAKLGEQWQWMECVSSATASSVENASLGAQNAIDGSMSTRWSSSFDNNQWLEIDLEQVRNIYGLTIYWEAAYAEVYNVQVSDDRSSWITVYSTSNGNGGTDDINFPEQQMEFIRINCITRATQYGSSIYEVELKSDDSCQGSSASWELLWSDEFDGSSLNLSNWSHQNGDGCPNLCGWGNNELQYYRTENTTVSGGNLVITAKAENYGGRNFTSGKIISRYKRDFLYGRIEARIKVPTGGGMWPAFWMMPTDEVYGGWAASGEIDIMETCNNTDVIGGTLHFGDNWPNNDSTGGDYAPGGVNFSDDFHVYAIEWGPDVIRWYVDDVLYSTKNSTQWYTNAAPGNAQAPFDQEFYIILNAAVGGWYTGCTEAGCITAALPQQMLVDYVRVYEWIP